jgi:hypothetical protein
MYQGDDEVFTGIVQSEDAINPNQYFLLNEIREAFHHSILKSIGTACSSLNELCECECANSKK